jgi:mannose-1-phosphate guanylyltransferase
MNNKNTYVAIMAGGVGSRFWPASRTARPKQFLDILGVGKSLLQMTYERFLALCPAENILIVTNAIYRDLVMEQLPGITPAQILCEPSRNNTAPCVAYTAFRLWAQDPKANFIIAPSDHLITNESLFVKTLEKALDFTAQHKAIVTLGIQPHSPHTGYGYIQYECQSAGRTARRTKRGRTQCPAPGHPLYRKTGYRATAQEFLSSGGYLWNAGIFVWSATTILDAFRQHATDIYDILEKGILYYNTSQEQDFIDREYPKTPNISVDYAILERSDNIYTIPSDFGWSDLGSWGAMHSETVKDAAGNVLIGDKVMLYDVTDSLVRVPAGKLVILKDLHDYIVVDEGDVLMVFPKSAEQDIKKVTADVERQLGGAFS